ncbi:MAG: ImmA/IrrE family metallo-endopeptidase [Myxococcota bacterium]
MRRHSTRQFRQIIRAHICAEGLRDRFGLDHRPNLPDLFDRMGITHMDRKLDPGDYGLVVQKDTRRFIVTAEGLRAKEKRWRQAQMLGWLLLHTGEGEGERHWVCERPRIGSLREIRDQLLASDLHDTSLQFAAELLMPEQDLLRLFHPVTLRTPYIAETFCDQRLSNTARRYGVSQHRMAMRLLDVGLLILNEEVAA